MKPHLEDLVVVALVIVGLPGGAVLAYMNFQPILVAVFLALGPRWAGTAEV